MSGLLSQQYSTRSQAQVGPAGGGCVGLWFAIDKRRRSFSSDRNDTLLESTNNLREVHGGGGGVAYILLYLINSKLVASSFICVLSVSRHVKLSDRPSTVCSRWLPPAYGSTESCSTFAIFMALGSGCVGGEEETELLTASNGNDGSNNSSSTKNTETGDQVRRRLAVCLFLHIAGVAIITQIYPKVKSAYTHMYVPLATRGVGG